MGRLRTIRSGFIVACALMGLQASAAAAASGGAMAWGTNSFGQLGNGHAGELAVDLAAPVDGLSDVTSVVGGESSGLALLADGTVMAWGQNESGQLGNGTNEPSLLPTPVSGLSNVVAISLRYRSCLALLSDGTVMAWGLGAYGQLGDGSFQNSNVPVPVSGLSGVTAISAGYTHSLALLGNGQVRAWGGNHSGELGNGGEVDTDVPVAVAGLSGVTAISAGDAHSLAVVSGGAAWAWGNDLHGQLGTESASNVPVPVKALSSGVAAVSAGHFYSLALLENGTAMAWGMNQYGELGDGASGEGTDRQEPIAVKGLTEASSVSAGQFNSLALLKNGTVAAWGGNELGELGIGTFAHHSLSSVPVPVCGLREVGGVFAGDLANYAYALPNQQMCPSVTSVSPAEGPLAGGTSVTIIGSEFTGVTAVKFAQKSVTAFTVNSPTSITAVSPSTEVRGPVSVSVTTTAGTSGANQDFNYLAPPTITKVTPAKGPVTGNTKVTISGTNLLQATSVKFGSSDATSFTTTVVNGSSEVIAFSPAEPAGSVEVVVKTPGGTTAGSTKAHFQFLPVVGGVAPNAGTTAGGTSVTITGAGFAVGKTATIIKFGATKAASVNCVSSTQCTVVSPAHAAGVVDVKATVNKATSAKNPSADQFTYG